MLHLMEGVAGGLKMVPSVKKEFRERVVGAELAIVKPLTTLELWCAQLDSNQRPSAPENDAQFLET